MVWLKKCQNIINKIYAVYCICLVLYVWRTMQILRRNWTFFFFYQTFSKSWCSTVSDCGAKMESGCHRICSTIVNAFITCVLQSIMWAAVDKLVWRGDQLFRDLPNVSSGQSFFWSICANGSHSFPITKGELSPEEFFIENVRFLQSAKQSDIHVLL